MDKKKPIIFIDLDGTLIDISERHYKVYKDVVSKLNGRPLPKSIYWKLKRGDTEWSNILTKSLITSNKFSLFIREFISKIELQENLFLDSYFPYTKKALTLLYKNYLLYLTSLRRSISNAVKQIDKLRLKKYFKSILISSRRDELISSIQQLIDKNGVVVVGDTEDQIQTAQELHLISVAVLSGIRGKSFLKKNNPNFIIRDINHLPKLLTKL